MHARELVMLNYGRALKADKRRPGKVPVYGTNGQCGWHDTALASGPGLILGRKGQGPLGVEWCEGDYWVIDTAYYVSTVNPGIDLKFLYYVIGHIGLNHLKDGTSNPTLSRDVFGRQLFPVPNLATQRSIVDLLGALDDRIDLLRQTNATLEAIAQALFKSWFIDFDPVRAKAEDREPEGMDATTAALFPAEFEESSLGLIPKGWRVARVGELIELAYGKALKASDRQAGSVPVYGSGGVTGYHNVALVGEPSVVVGRKGTVGALYWEDRPFFPIDTTFYVKPRAAPLTFCYYALQRLGLEHMNTDAAVPGLNRGNAYRLELVSPPHGVLEAFDEVAMSLRQATRGNSSRADLLTSVRDAILPRLISGKLHLAELQAPIEAALA